MGLALRTAHRHLRIHPPATHTHTHTTVRGTRKLFQPIHDERGSVIGFTEAVGATTNVYDETTRFVGYADSAATYSATGVRIADSPLMVGLLLEHHE